jgi:hypothetical protein
MNGGDDALDDVGGRRTRLDAGQHETELVTTEAGNHVALADAGPQTLSDDDQQLVTLMVPVLVVDFLEAIEVDQRQRARSPRRAQHLLNRRVERPPVGDAGQRIGAWRNPRSLEAIPQATTINNSTASDIVNNCSRDHCEAPTEDFVLATTTIHELAFIGPPSISE